MGGCYCFGKKIHGGGGGAVGVDSATGYPIDAQGNYRTSTAMGSGVEPYPHRRLQQSPVLTLAKDTGCTLGHPSYLPDHGRKLAESHLPKLSVPQDPCGLPGLNDRNIWWIVPISCLTQLMWIYVAYKIYKRCAQPQRRSENSPRHELREITVRR